MIDSRFRLPAYLFHECLEIPELFQDGFVSDGSDILDVVKGLTLLFAGHTPQGFTRVDTFQDTKSPKVFESDLKHFQAFGSSNKGSFEATFSSFLFLAHARQFTLAARVRGDCRLDGLLLGPALDTVTTHGSRFPHNVLQEDFQKTTTTKDVVVRRVDNRYTFLFLFSDEDESFEWWWW